jgi:hypothetical protein
VRPLARASDAAADLVELREPELVGALDDQRVGTGMSIPDSMIVVQTRTSASPRTKRNITCSSSSSSI